MDASLLDQVIAGFQERFTQEPRHIIQAPGRVNLIGEHTDYSDGFVLPVAINFGIVIAFRPRQDKMLKVHSLDFDDCMSVDLNGLEKGPPSWHEYIKGVAWVLMENGYDLTGWEGVMAGNVPIGAGLSSSAALEMATAKAFCLTSSFEMAPADLALTGQRAEGDWVGVNVGIMDQLISAAGKAGHAILIDCRSLDYETVPVPDGVSFFVLDTSTRRELTNSAYNTRRQECETAAEIMGVPILREADLSMLEANKSIMPDPVFRRARHVISENERVHAFSAAMRNGNLEQMGRLINACHFSLERDFEVSSTELNIITSIAREHPACIGARMTGAGFGGCALALVRTDEAGDLASFVHQKYFEQTGIEPRIFPVESADGVGEIL